MAATPITDHRWGGLPLLECVMDPGRYELYMQVPRLIVRESVGTHVEVFSKAGQRVAFQQAPLRFDLFGPGLDITAVSDHPGTRSLVVALPKEWIPEDDAVPGERMALRPRFQFGDASLRRLVWRLKSYHERGAPLGESYSRAVSRSIVERVVSLQLAWIQGGTSLDPEARHLVTSIIQDHLQDTLTVPQLAARVGMSLTSFARKFRATFHATPHQYIREQRLRRALEMLNGTDASLTTIALESGFASHAHFSTTFHAVMGMTPSDYRRSAPMPRRSARRPRSVDH
jgi:AraC family transcriptional regulator